MEGGRGRKGVAKEGKGDEKEWKMREGRGNVVLHAKILVTAVKHPQISA